MRHSIVILGGLLFTVSTLAASAQTAGEHGPFSAVPGYENKVLPMVDIVLKKKKRKPKLACVELGDECQQLSDCCSDATYCSWAAGCSLGTKCCN
jgi:hypothetical protein